MDLPMFSTRIVLPMFRFAYAQYTYGFALVQHMYGFAYVEICLCIDLAKYEYRFVRVWICHNKPTKLHSRNPSHQRWFFQTAFKHPSAHHETTKLTHVIR